MKKLMSLLVIVMLAVLALGIGLQAQDSDVTLEQVASDASAYYGQELSFTGTIENFLSPHIFILGEDALLDNDQVLVINRSGQVFPMNIAEGSMVTVTGTIYPSRNEWAAGTFSEGFQDFAIDTEVGNNEYFGSIRNSSITSANPEATVEGVGDAGTMGQTGMMADWGSFDVDTASFFYNGWLLEDFADYTVMVLTNIDSVSLSTEGESTP